MKNKNIIDLCVLINVYAVYVVYVVCVYVVSHTNLKIRSFRGWKRGGSQILRPRFFHKNFKKKNTEAQKLLP